MKQAELFAGAPSKPTSAEKFAKFLSANPWFLTECIRMAREHKAAGNKRWSMKALFELNRHKFRRDTGYGLNNDFSAPMSRLVMREAPDLAQFFETR